MVFESLINPINARKQPWELFFLGLIYVSISLTLSFFIFDEDASLVAIFLTSLVSTPLLYSSIKIEEKKDLSIQDEGFLLKEHGKTLSFLMFLFAGFVIAFSLFYIFMPQDATSVLFSSQLRDIRRIESVSYSITGNAINTASTLSAIFLNNIKVMIFCIIFSLFFGAGAIFILSWNASIIGTAIGNFVKSNLHLPYFSAIPLGLLRYSIHGIPEIVSYFMAGLAGGIVSVAVIRHDFGSGKFRHILKDSSDLIAISVIILFIAALLEVFVTPIFF